MASKLSAEPNGGWSGPVEFEVKNIDYSLPQLPLAGGISRIAFNGRSAGPSLDALDKLRETIDGLRADDGQSPEARGAAFLAALSSMTAPFSSINGDFAVDGARRPKPAGEALVSLAKAGITIAITGLDSADGRAPRSAFSMTGSSSRLRSSNRPRCRAAPCFDLGVDDISTQALAQAASRREHDCRSGRKETRTSRGSGRQSSKCSAPRRC